jgi:hypothetical protein
MAEANPSIQQILGPSPSSHNDKAAQPSTFRIAEKHAQYLAQKMHVVESLRPQFMSPA